MSAALFAFFTISFQHIVDAHLHGAYSHDSDIGGGNEDWMLGLSDNLKMTELNLPGTHDTMTDDNDGPNVDCQSLTLPKQLHAGIRVLDIRCMRKYNAFKIHHAEFDLSATFDDVLQDCTDFLSSHPSEFILMRVKEEHEQDDADQTFGKIFDGYYNRDSYKSFFYVMPAGDHIPTVNEVRGKIVVLQDFTGDPHISTQYGMMWNTFDVQDEFNVVSIWDIYDKWTSIKHQLNKANEDASFSKLYINFLSGNVGSFPYTIASGHSNPATGAPRLSTGETEGPLHNKNKLPDYPRTSCFLWSCTISIEGTNILTYNHIDRFSFIGIIMIDFPGKALINKIIRKNPMSTHCPSDDYLECAVDGSQCVIPSDIGSGFISHGANGRFVLIPFTNTANTPFYYACGSSSNDIWQYRTKTCCRPIATVPNGFLSSSWSDTTSYSLGSNIIDASLGYEFAVEYGKDGQYVYRSVLGINLNVNCGNALFGDPAPGHNKRCRIHWEYPPLITALNENDQWSVCGDEGGMCNGLRLNDAHWIRYGVENNNINNGGKYFYQFVINKNDQQIPCDNVFFGDSAPGFHKNCWKSPPINSVYDATPIRLIPSNFPSHFVRNSYSGLRIDERSSDPKFIADSTFNVKLGLGGYISLESSNNLHFYVRHTGFRMSIGVGEEPWPILYSDDASWKVVSALNGRDGYISLQSKNYPNHYARHKASELWIDPYEALNTHDASFKMVCSESDIKCLPNKINALFSSVTIQSNQVDLGLCFDSGYRQNDIQGVFSNGLKYCGCDNGMGIKGIYRSSGTNLYNIEYIQCGKPPLLGPSSCRNKDVRSDFDNAMNVKCDSNEYLSGFLLNPNGNCQHLDCIEEFKCCTFSGYEWGTGDYNDWGTKFDREGWIHAKSNQLIIGLNRNNHDDLTSIEGADSKYLIKSDYDTIPIRLISSNYPSQFVRYSNSGLRIDEGSSDPTFIAESTFNLKPGLAGDEYSSLESSVYTFYVRHSGYRISIAREEPSQVYKDDASWRVVPGLNGRVGYISLQSKNYPNHYARHKASELWIDPYEPHSLYKDDASFKMMCSESEIKCFQNNIYARSSAVNIASNQVDLGLCFDSGNRQNDVQGVFSNDLKYCGCDNGKGINGIYRSSGTNLYNIEYIQCGEPPLLGPSSCRNKDVRSDFDNAMNVQCDSNEYLSGFLLNSNGNCQHLDCIEEFKCCTFSGYEWGIGDYNDWMVSFDSTGWVYAEPNQLIIGLNRNSHDDLTSIEGADSKYLEHVNSAINVNEPFDDISPISISKTESYHISSWIIALPFLVGILTLINIFVIIYTKCNCYGFNKKQKHEVVNYDDSETDV